MRYILLLLLAVYLSSCGEERVQTPEELMAELDSMNTSRVLQTKFASNGEGFYEKHMSFTITDSSLTVEGDGCPVIYTLFRRDGELWGVATLPSWDIGEKISSVKVKLHKEGNKYTSIKLEGYTFTNTPVTTKNKKREYIVEKGDTPTSVAKILDVPVNRLPKKLNIGDRIEY